MTNDEIEALESKIINDLKNRHNTGDTAASDIILKHIVSLKDLDIIERHLQAQRELDRAKFMREGKTS